MAPYLLLFLDCVWQITQQLPTALEMSETYLTTLWDSAHLTIFDTFIFNSEHQRRTVSYVRCVLHTYMFINYVVFKYIILFAESTSISSAICLGLG